MFTRVSEVLRVFTWDINDRTMPKVPGEQISIHGGAHQNDLEVRSLWQQVSHYHHQEVTGTQDQIITFIMSNIMVFEMRIMHESYETPLFPNDIL